MTDATASGTSFPAEAWRAVNETTGFTYEVSVEVPNRYPGTDARYPLVVCLDGLWTTGIVRDAFRILPLGRELPEAVVVGVAHADPDLREVLQQRAVDFTPTAADSPPVTGVRLPAAEVGKAGAFRRFLLDSVIAPIADRYRVSDDRTLVGHSFSALFGLDTLFTEPSAFDRWVLASPSVWWDRRIMFEREAKLAATTNDLVANVFLSAGELEGGAEGFGGHEAIYRRLAERNYASLRLQWVRFPAETHQSVIAPALVRGLRSVFA